MKATFDGTTVMNIEYSAKEIKPHFCKLTGEMEFDCYFDGRYVGTANSHGAAAAKLDELAYDALTRGETATATELDGGNEGDCETELAASFDMDFSSDLPTVNAQLRSQGLRKARGWEAGWYVTVVEFGRARKVWACEAAEPVAKAPLQFFSYSQAKGV